MRDSRFIDVSSCCCEPRHPKVPQCCQNSKGEFIGSPPPYTMTFHGGLLNGVVVTMPFGSHFYTAADLAIAIPALSACINSPPDLDWINFTFGCFTSPGNFDGFHLGWLVELFFSYAGGALTGSSIAYNTNVVPGIAESCVPLRATIGHLTPNPATLPSTCPFPTLWDTITVTS